MSLSRRQVLGVMGAGLLSGPACLARGSEATQRPDIPKDWPGIRGLFELDRNQIHMAGLWLASHPAPVRRLIEEHRKGLDNDPVNYSLGQNLVRESAVRTAAGTYLNTSPANIALTDSTTMGLAMLYNGIEIRTDQEFLTSTHDHSSTYNSIRFRCQKTGQKMRQVPLYSESAKANPAEVLANLKGALKPETRVVAVTWVHSSTGVKLPIAEMSKVIAEANLGRSEENRILFCVDGVHGFGNQDIDITAMGCDFLAAGTHKWLFGPRGTGILYAKKEAQPFAKPTIPSFSGPMNWGAIMTPGGFHSFEHRWALSAAFDMHREIGKARIATRIAELNTQMKEGLAKMPRVKLYTPMDTAMSAALVCFDVEGMPQSAVVRALAKARIIASSTPYAVSYARVTPGLLNDPSEVDRTLAAIHDLARA